MKPAQGLQEKDLVVIDYATGLIVVLFFYSLVLLYILPNVSIFLEK